MKFVPPKGKEQLGDTAEYVDADIISGVEGSIVPAAAMNQLLREMINTIKLSGLVPSGEDLTQLYQAMGNVSVAWSQEMNYINQVIVMSSGKMYTLIKPSGPTVLDTDGISVVGYKKPDDNQDYWKEFSTFKKSDIKYLEDQLTEVSGILDAVSTNVTKLSSIHTTTGVATSTVAGHVIPGKTLTVNNVGLIDVNIDNQTIKKSSNDVLYAEVPSALTATNPIEIVDDSIGIKIDSNTLIIKDNKLSVNPAVINGDDAEKTTVNSVLLNELNTLRKLSIGRPVFHTSTTLPDDHVWIDGSFISFEDRPEFASRYLDDAFEGMILEWNASSTDISNNPGKFRKNAANPTGLFLPSNGALFMRLWNETVTDVTAGSRNEAGLPNATGGINAVATLSTTTNKTGVFSSSDVPGTFGYTGGAVYRNYVHVNFSLADANTIYGNSTTVMPESTNIPVIMYLGKTEALNEVFYNNGTQQLPIASGMDLGVMKVDNKQFTVDKFGTLHLNGYVPTTTDLTKEILTADGTYTVPHSGWYKIICIGGGGAGGSTPASNTSVTLSGYGGNQGKSTIFGTYVSAIGGSGGGGSTHQFYGSGGGGCGEIVEQYLFLTRGEEIPYTIGAGGIVNNSVQQNGQGPTGGKSNTTDSVSAQVYGTGALNAGNGTATNYFGANNEAGGQGGFGAPSPHGYGAGGGGAGGNSVGRTTLGGAGGKAGSIYAEAGTNGAITNIVRSGGAGAPGAIIIETMSILQGSIDVASVPTQETIVSNSVYTPETSSWYEITIIGGGGGGGCDPGNITSAISGGGGGQGEHKTIYKKLSPTKPLTISIGRGGVGSTLDTEAEDGFTTTVDIGGEIISAEGGKKGTRYIGGQGGGTGISSGLPGHNGNVNTYGDGNTIVNTVGGMGGGSNAGYVTYTITESGETISKINATGYGSGGGGGWGGNSSNPLRSGGSNGCQGAVIIKKLISGGGSGTAVDVDIATTNDVGIVRPDGKTINIDATGTISVTDVTTIQTFTPYKETIAESGDWICPKSGWYKADVIGGGGGGAGGSGTDTLACGGAGGNSGELKTVIKYINKGTVCNISVGAGGAAGPKNNGNNVFVKGYSGGSTTFEIDDESITAQGGAPGGLYTLADGGSSTATAAVSITLNVENGNYNSGAPGTYDTAPATTHGSYATPGVGGKYDFTIYGAGGKGSSGTNTVAAAGSRLAGIAGTSGAVILEYLSSSSSPMDSELLNEFNKLRKTSIGRLVYHTSSVLPDTDHVWADGKTFVKFSERPEFKQKFDNGGFDSMLMAWDAGAATIAANRGKYRPDAAVPTGLWVPNVTNLFIEGWTSDSAHDAGSKTEAGLPNITASVSGKMRVDSAAGAAAPSGGAGYDYTHSSQYGTSGFNIYASRSSPIYGNSDTVQPNSTNIPMMIYLGRTTGDDVLYYNPETTGLIKAATPSDKGVVTVDNKTIAVDDNGQLFSRIIPPLLLGLEWTHSVSEDGYLNLSVDNGLLTRSDYKEGWDKISKLDPSMVLDDTAWLAEKTAKGWVNKYSSGDGNLTFRVPLWSKEYIATMTPGSVKQVGDTVIDEMRPITGEARLAYCGTNSSTATINGAIKLSASSSSASNDSQMSRLNVIKLDSSLLGPNYSGDVTHGPGAILYPQLRIKNYVEDRATIDPDNEVYVRHDHALLDTFFNPLTIMPGCLDMSIDHGLLSRATYANAWDKISKQAGTNLITDEEWLAEVAANGVCAKFSSGDGIHTFRIPYVKKMYIRATGDDVTSGDHLEAGLPNITGATIRISNYTGNNASAVTGAFNSTQTEQGNIHGAGAYGSHYNDTFDASRSSSIYGNSDTVTPESICWIPWIKMYGVITNPNDIDINGLLEERVKLNSSFGFPSNQYVDISSIFKKSGDSYNAPDNGYVYMEVQGTLASRIWIRVNGPSLNDFGYLTAIGDFTNIKVEVTKGDKLTLSSSGDFQTTISRFIPAISHNPSTPLPLEEEATSDYTLEESYTGSRWIDGKKIYRLVYKWDSIQTFAANTWIATPVASTNIDVLVSGKLMNTNKLNSATATFVANNVIVGNGLTLNNCINVHSAGVLTYGNALILEYTKIDESI